MLVIFDLDDTLIETSKCLTPFALIRAFDAMQEKGFQAQDQAVEELLAINETSLSSQDALATFTALYPDREYFFKIGCDTLCLPMQRTDSIEPVPHALAVLDHLSKNHSLALVTRGDPSCQIEKMEKAGIQAETFSKLMVSRGATKRDDYEAILDCFECLPSNGVVCGDRVPLDLTPAKELGLYTIHFRNGRGLSHMEPQESVDVTIDCLTELEEVLAKNEA